MAKSLFNDCNVETIPIKDVVTWTQEEGPSRLFLPPIQRSVVWNNAQIINYWDSLLRGYPAGLMLVHKSRQNSDGEFRARTTDGETRAATAGDFHLFDGQQRLTTILLGLHSGQLNSRVKLWVDLGATTSDSDLLFQLRISSTGQPFGYQAQSPNQKPSLDHRRRKINKWKETNGSKHAFANVQGKDIIDAVCAVPFYEVVSVLLTQGLSEAMCHLKRQFTDIPNDQLHSFVHALDLALKTPILFQLIEGKVIEDEKEYIRYFGRLGQGGSPLSNDELTYSILKHRYPEIHDRMREITDGPAGRLASEVNLALASLRVAKVLAPWEAFGTGDIIGRPNPEFVSRLRDLPGVAIQFRQMIPASPGGRLREMLERVRERLVYDKTSNPGGLPVMLLARMPHQLVDVLLLMATRMEQGLPRAGEQNLLPPFVLYWLLFVSDHDNAASVVFRQFLDSGCIANQHSMQTLIQHFEKEAFAPPLPVHEQLPPLRQEIDNGTHRLRSWSERFVYLDINPERQCGNALRVLSTNGELIKRALIWIQREYLDDNFQHFDPTSSRDEDLPIDLDHLIPQARFGFDWRSHHEHIAFDDAEWNFCNHRRFIGNTLGNFRWLDAATNRSRGAQQIEPLEKEGDFIRKVDPWNYLIATKPWTTNDGAAFQKLIDHRTVDVYESLLTDGNLNALIEAP